MRILAVLAVLAVSLPAAAADKNDLIAFVRSYAGTDWSAKGYAMFLKAQKLKSGPALDYLDTLDEAHEKDGNAEIYKLSSAHAWTPSIADFKIKAHWAGGDDLQAAAYATLPAIVEEMGKHLAAAHGKPHEKATRSLYATLLAQVLPIYFVKAANIGEMIAKLETLNHSADGFVDLVCGKQTDYPPAKSGSSLKPDPTGAYDCGRGFEVRTRKADKKAALVLTFNPHADVDQSHTKAVHEAIAKKYE